MADAAHALLVSPVPTLSLVNVELNAVHVAAHGLAVACTDLNRLAALRADRPGFLASSPEEMDRWTRSHRLCRARALSALQEYIGAVQALTRECSRGLFVSPDQPSCADFQGEVELFCQLRDFGLTIPF